MDELVEKIEALIRPVLDLHQVYLVEVQLRGEGNSRVLSIYADTESGITLREITELTREISDLLDIHDIIPGRYRLEVSSPGLDRPLTELWQFRRNVGRHLKVEYLDEQEVPHTISGKLTAADEQEIVLQAKKQEWHIPRERIKKAKIQIKF